jgi:hypothetical protein
LRIEELLDRQNRFSDAESIGRDACSLLVASLLRAEREIRQEPSSNGRPDGDRANAGDELPQWISTPCVLALVCDDRVDLIEAKRANESCRDQRSRAQETEGQGKWAIGVDEIDFGREACRSVRCQLPQRPGAEPTSPQESNDPDDSGNAGCKEYPTEDRWEGGGRVDEAEVWMFRVERTVIDSRCDESQQPRSDHDEHEERRKHDGRDRGSERESTALDGVPGCHLRS